MSLKLKYNNANDVPEALREFYAEDEDGNFVLDADGLHTDDDIAALKIVVNKERKLRREAETKAGRVPEDFDEEGYAAFKAAGGKESIDEKLRQQADKYAKLLAEEQAKTAAASKRANGMIIQSALAKGLSENNVAHEAMGLLSSKFANDAEVVDDDVLIGGLPVADAVKSYMASEEGKYFAADRNNRGGGSAGTGSGGATLKKMEDYKESELRELKRSDPTAFDAVMEEFDSRARA